MAGTKRQHFNYDKVTLLIDRLDASFAVIFLDIYMILLYSDLDIDGTYWQMGLWIFG